MQSFLSRSFTARIRNCEGVNTEKHKTAVTAYFIRIQTKPGNHKSKMNILSYL